MGEQVAVGFRFILSFLVVFSIALPRAPGSTLTLLASERHSIDIEDIPLNEEDRNLLFSSVSEADFKLFQEKRVRYLQHAYNVLLKFRWFLGTTERVGRKIRLWTQPEPFVSILNPEASLSEFGRSNDRTLRFGNNAIREKLEFINRELWVHAPVVIRSNEFGGVFAIAPNAGAAAGKMGFYRSVSLGLAISYNHQASYIRVEMISDFEKLLIGIPGQINAGVTLKMGGFIANRTTNGTDENAFLNARSSYPLGPFGIEDSSSHFAAILPFTMGVVPYPFDGFMGVQNTTTRKILLSRKFQCSSLAKTGSSQR